METRVTREYEQFDEFIRLTNQTAVEAVLSAEAETKVWSGLIDYSGIQWAFSGSGIQRVKIFGGNGLPDISEG